MPEHILDEKGMDVIFKQKDKKNSKLAQKWKLFSSF